MAKTPETQGIPDIQAVPGSGDWTQPEDPHQQADAFAERRFDVDGDEALARWTNPTGSGEKSPNPSTVTISGAQRAGESSTSKPDNNIDRTFISRLLQRRRS
ncbi:MAG TPA: hypothetical protein VMR28_01530 [Candidatus Saccharimonadales bacterium]|nr:hypothetical protein [Candidatus Saccharimonadales bacterium]